MKASLMGAAILAVMVPVTAAPCLADDMKTVSCSGFELSYSDASAKQSCAELDQQGNQTEAEYKRLEAETSSYFLTVTVGEGKFKTYFPERELRDQVDSAHFFADTDNWLEIRKFAGFEIAAFDGYRTAGATPTLCVAFSRYTGNMSGQYEYPGGPGYKNHTLGLYCPLTGQAALINPPDNLYRAAEDAIGKLQLPQ